ncbi:MAG: Fe-S cluster assembly protein SufD, partial [Synechococcaceae cyanobacterium SM2_3_60]|nr:Fe-S cluster assembly protein SufD [Synechococcaceae cyanobacterium SM2_3_60]
SSSQASRTLLRSNKARIDSQPQLEILADDVKCTHGATVGELEPSEVFYMQSRGLERETAINLLTYAFAAEILEALPVASLRQEWQKRVQV